MNGKAMQEIARHAIQFVERFFGNLTEVERDLVPSVLRASGTWMANYDESMLGMFFLNETEQQRATENQSEGWPAFPGFITSEGKKNTDAPVAFSVSGSCNFFSSNHTTNNFAFRVSPGSSFAVVDHFHEVRDSSGREFKYRVDLAFVLGIRQGEQWAGVECRLSELLNHSMSVWRSLR